MKNFIQKNFTTIVLVITLLSFFKGCGTSMQVKTTEKHIELLTKKVDSLSTIVVSQDKLINIIKETPNWKTLEIEELSDKNHMPINHYKNELGQ